MKAKMEDKPNDTDWTDGAAVFVAGLIRSAGGATAAWGALAIFGVGAPWWGIFVAFLALWTVAGMWRHG